MGLGQIYILAMLPQVKMSILSISQIATAIVVGLFVLGTIASGLQLIVKFIFSGEAVEKSGVQEAIAKLWKWIGKLLGAYALGALLVVIIPSEKTMAVIVGSYVVTNIEGISKLPENVVGAINTSLENIRAGNSGDLSGLKELDKAAEALKQVK